MTESTKIFYCEKHVMDCMNALQTHDAEIEELQRKLALKEESRRELINRNNMNRWPIFAEYTQNRA